LTQQELFRRMIIRFATSNSLNLGAVAELIGVDTKTVAKWMSGELVPHNSIQKPIEEILKSTDLGSANNSDS
jgi:ribosome-binding protein aMBF1 (putative translation factor)